MPDITNSKYTYNDVLEMCSAIEFLIDGFSNIYRECDGRPLPNSRAMMEYEKSQNKDLIYDVYSRSELSIESAADHLYLFEDACVEPVKTIATWTCLRGLLESCAIGLWLLDTNIDAKERVGRCFNFRYDEFTEQLKLLEEDRGNARKNGDHDKESLICSDIEKVNKIKKETENIAVSLNYKIFPDKNGNPNNIHLGKPNIIELISKTLHRATEYRFLSGIAHGRHSYLRLAGFATIKFPNSSEPDKTFFEKQLQPDLVLYGAKIGITSFAKLVWNFCKLYGWDLDRMKIILEKTYDSLHYSDEKKVLE